MQAVVFLALLLVLALAPLPLGSNREWSWTLLCSALALIGLAWSLVSAMDPARHIHRLPAGVVLLFLAVIAWAMLQASGLTPGAWDHPLWALGGEVLGGEMNGSISLAPDDSWTATLRLLAYGLAFFLAFQLCHDVRRARQLFLLLVLAGTAQAIYGLAVYWGGEDSFLGFWELPYSRSVRGTFVNRNHFATWLGICLLCLIALFFQRGAVRRNPAYQLPVNREVRLEQWLSAYWKPLAALIVLTAALVLTHSRGGFISTLLGGVTLLWLLQRRQAISSRRARWVLAASLGVVLASFLITSEFLFERLDRATVDLPFRMQAYELSQAGIDDNGVLGFGYGTFADSFRLYRAEGMGFFDKAHNTYLENIFELGWPAALALFACLAWIALICWRGVRKRGRDWVFPAAGLAVIVLVGIHALVDFSVQMPATAVTFAAVLGVGCAQSRSSRPQS